MVTQVDEQKAQAAAKKAQAQADADAAAAKAQATADAAGPPNERDALIADRAATQARLAELEAEAAALRGSLGIGAGTITLNHQNQPVG